MKDEDIDKIIVIVLSELYYVECKLALTLSLSVSLSGFIWTMWNVNK